MCTAGSSDARAAPNGDATLSPPAGGTPGGAPLAGWEASAAASHAGGSFHADAPERMFYH
jgi:hypothetical protein